MHLRPTQELTDQTLPVKAQYLGVHLPSNTTTKACSTMKACHNMDHMGMEAMVVDSQSSGTCRLGGILGSRTPQSSHSKEMQALHRISDRLSVVVKVAFRFIPQVLRRVWADRCLSSFHICKSISILLSVSTQPNYGGYIGCPNIVLLNLLCYIQQGSLCTLPTSTLIIAFFFGIIEVEFSGCTASRMGFGRRVVGVMYIWKYLPAITRAMGTMTGAKIGQ